MQQLFFDTPNGELIVNVPETVNLTPAERVWRSLVIQRLQDLTIRSGMVFCGVYPNSTVPEHPPANYDASGRIAYSGIGCDIPETVTHHVRSCIAFTRLLSNEFPVLFKPNIVATRDNMISLFEYHDGDEPFFGDMPDDGSQDKKSKDERELQTFLRNIAYLSDENLKANLVKAFVHFQYCTPLHALYPGWTARDRDIAQLTRLIDKTDAILSTLLAERTGHAGRLNHKAHHYGSITDDDAYYTQLCGTDRIADAWMAHFLHNYHDYYGFRVILSVIHAAVLEVRGNWYPWWDNVCKTFGINPTLPN